MKDYCNMSCDTYDEILFCDLQHGTVPQRETKCVPLIHRGACVCQSEYWSLVLFSAVCMHFPETPHPFHTLDLYITVTTSKSIHNRNHINMMNGLTSVLQVISCFCGS
jgi:hypothetical protein